MNISTLHIGSLNSFMTSSLPSTCSTNDDDNYTFSDALFSNVDHLHFVGKISESKFPVYQVFCSKTDQQYAIKLFYWDDDEPSECYTNELEFAKFRHSNIINIVDHEQEQELLDEGCDSIKVSYILMEYAKYGDLYDALITRRIPFNDILIRTYFHQLIEGMEALHSKGAAHLDIKLENLLIGDNYTLKLTDFDMSYLPKDGEVKARGTKNYRAPEIMRATCRDPYAADIYSAGIVLFLLKTRGKIAFKDGESLVNPNKANSKLFWEDKVKMMGESTSFFEEEFKELFMMMTRSEPRERLTLAEIKSSNWYNMDVYSQEELEEFMNNKFCF